MTVEVVAFNKQGIAVAVDSAVTINGGKFGNDRFKVFNTENKLFTLSKYAPVGIMVYGGLTLNDTPIKHLIKQFRNEIILDVKYPTLEEYCDAFINFLNTNNYVKDEIIQKILEEQLFYCFLLFTHTASSLIENSDNLIDETLSLLESFLKNKLDDIYFKNDNIILNTNIATAIAKSDSTEDLKNKLNKFFNVFSLEQRTKLEKIYTLYVKKQVDFEIREKMTISGLVIMGYGNNDFYPKIINLETIGMVHNSIKIIKKEEFEINNFNKAFVKSFAQTSMIDLFLNGISSDIKYQINNIIQDFTSNPSLTDNQSKLEEIKKIIEQMQSRNNEDIISSLSYLNKEDMLDLVERLVGLQALKKTVSGEDATVGGPIDIAFISKYDGFIWIRRKLYFDKNLNPCFMENYFKK